INKIALVAPCAKLNIIRDYDVVEKRVVEIPDEIFGRVERMAKIIVANENSRKISVGKIRFGISSKQGRGSL
ncbi:MAG: hypothetical protein P8Y83_11860, partial [Gammaproteobacteria bacterium]